MEAITLFKEALEWLKNNYNEKPFFFERDLVWTVQTYLIKQIWKLNLQSEYQVINEYPIKDTNLCADLAIIQNGIVRLIAEFKYEPNHKRISEFSESKFKQPIVFWSSVEEDINRTKQFSINKEISDNLIGISVFIDEGQFFCKNPKYADRKWKIWENGVAALVSWSNDDY